MKLKQNRWQKKKEEAAIPPSKATFAGTYGLFLGFYMTTSWPDEQNFKNEL